MEAALGFSKGNRTEWSLIRSMMNFVSLAFRDGDFPPRPRQGGKRAWSTAIVHVFC